METRSTTTAALVLAVCFIIGCLSSPALADEKGPRVELGVQGGLFQPDDKVTDKNDTLREIEAIGGIRFGWLFGKRFGWFVDTTTSDINVGSSGDVDSRAARTGFEVFTRPYWKKLQWFFALGGGIVDIDPEIGDDFSRDFASVSLGQRVALDRRARFRWEVRGDRFFDDDDVFEGEDLTRLHFLVAVTWGLGKIRSDADGDGVYDRTDACPDTPLGAVVDERGCPLDSDGDGVYDGIDRCPDTPKGATVDEWGCPMDSDDDGVYDGIDRCPDTPKGAIVDEWGCPMDSDGDGVYDGIDRCPNTPRGAIVVDRWGCPVDSDGDGVYDGLDKCPGTPRGVKVDPDGCPIAEPLFEEDRKTLILEGVFFEFDEAVLTPESAGTLNRVADSLLAWPEVRVEIAGHTDWIGSDEYNLDLSDRRAAAVRDYLIGRGVPGQRMTSRGYGETRPLADNQSEAGRAKNRRVELTKLE